MIAVAEAVWGGLLLGFVVGFVWVLAWRGLWDAD